VGASSTHSEKREQDAPTTLAPEFMWMKFASPASFIVVRSPSEPGRDGVRQPVKTLAALRRRAH